MCTFAGLCACTRTYGWSVRESSMVLVSNVLAENSGKARANLSLFLDFYLTGNVNVNNLEMMH